MSNDTVNFLEIVCSLSLGSRIRGQCAELRMRRGSNERACTWRISWASRRRTSQYCGCSERSLHPDSLYSLQVLRFSEFITFCRALHHVHERHEPRHGLKLLTWRLEQAVSQAGRAVSKDESQGILHALDGLFSCVQRSARFPQARSPFASSSSLSALTHAE